MRRRISIVLLIALLIPVALVGCGGKDTDSSSGTSGENTLIVGLEAAYAPFNWTQLDDSNGAVKINDSEEYAGGYDVQIAKKLAEALDRELVIEKLEWDGLLPALTSGTIDVVIAGMSPTEERRQSIDFSDVYYESDLVMVVREDGPYVDASSIQDFSGAKVTGQLNTFHYTVIDQIDGVIKETAMQDFSTMRVALQSGMIDGYVSERPEAVSATEANEDFTFVEFEDGFVASTDDTAIAVGVKKGSSLREEINEVLGNISKEERQSIMDDAIKNQPKNQ